MFKLWKCAKIKHSKNESNLVTDKLAELEAKHDFKQEQKRLKRERKLNRKQKSLQL